MVWVGDKAGKPVDRQALLDERAELVEQIKSFKQLPKPTSSAAARFRQEDMEKLAKRVLAIDKALGR